MNTIDILYALLATLPKCAECDKPATRVIVAKATIPEEFGQSERGKTFKEVVDKYERAPAAGLKRGTWNWEVCDACCMPARMNPHTQYDLEHATTVRYAYDMIEATTMVQNAKRIVEAVNKPAHNRSTWFPDADTSFAEVVQRKIVR